MIVYKCDLCGEIYTSEPSKYELPAINETDFKIRFNRVSYHVCEKCRNEIGDTMIKIIKRRMKKEYSDG